MDDFWKRIENVVASEVTQSGGVSFRDPQDRKHNEDWHSVKKKLANLKSSVWGFLGGVTITIILATFFRGSSFEIGFLVGAICILGALVFLKALRWYGNRGK